MQRAVAMPAEGTPGAGGCGRGDGRAGVDAGLDQQHRIASDEVVARRIQVKPRRGAVQDELPSVALTFHATGPALPIDVRHVWQPGLRWHEPGCNGICRLPAR